MPKKANPPKTPADLIEAIDLAIKDIASGQWFSDATKEALKPLNKNQKESFASIVAYGAVTDPKLKRGLKKALQGLLDKAEAIGTSDHEEKLSLAVTRIVR